VALGLCLTNPGAALDQKDERPPEQTAGARLWPVLSRTAADGIGQSFFNYLFLNGSLNLPAAGSWRL